LKDDCSGFAKKENAKSIVEKYSNFINFPLILNGEKLNLISAIWTRNKNELKEEDYKTFYEFFTKKKSNFQYKVFILQHRKIFINFYNIFKKLNY